MSVGDEVRRRKLVLGSRGSNLALAQTRLVERALLSVNPAVDVEIRIVRTRGDEGAASVAQPDLDPRAGRKGLFTGEIERELLARNIDVAVHSAKDLPSELTAGTRLIAALPRASTDDVLVTKCRGGFDSLPEGSCVGTSSVRRQHQLRAMRPDLHVMDLRGNVPTRLRKLVEQRDLHGIILARAGLERLGFALEDGRLEIEGFELRANVLQHDEFLPPGGQGIVALQIREDDEACTRMVSAVNDTDAFVCLRAEREFLRLLQGDCGSPVGVLATLNGDALSLRAQVFEPETGDRQTGQVEGSRQQPELLARDLMKQLHGR
jgi:hydroxymethylbilane synthase